MARVKRTLPSLAMVRLPIALFFSASRSKNWSSLALSSVWAYPAVDNANVSKVGNNILIFIKAFLLPRYGGKSGYRIFLGAGADVDVRMACQMYRNSGGKRITTIAAHTP